MYSETVGGGGPTLYMTVAAKDKTKEVLDRVKSNINVFANNVYVSMERASEGIDKTTQTFNRLTITALTTMNRIGSVATSFATLGRITGMLTDEQARAIGVFGVAINIFASVATAVKALTAIEWAHVAALTWKVSLMTLGIGVAIAAAAAIAVLAMQTNKAADAQKNYNVQLEKGTKLQRRETSQKIVGRSGYVEILD